MRRHSDESKRLREFAESIEHDKRMLAEYLRARAKALMTEDRNDWDIAWRAQARAEEAELVNVIDEIDYLDFPIIWNGKKDIPTDLYITINGHNVQLLRSENIKFASRQMIENAISDAQTVLNCSNASSLVDNLHHKFNGKTWKVIETCGKQIEKLIGNRDK